MASTTCHRSHNSAVTLTKRQHSITLRDPSHVLEVLDATDSDYHNDDEFEG